MPNSKHIKILKQGVEVWNEWREEHPEIKVDLSELDLRNCDLHKINLKNANLYRTNFENAQLFDANLTDAILWNANMSRSNLIGAKLCRADLRHGIFEKAILFKADCEGAYFNEANFEGASIHEANFARSVFYNASLRKIFLSDAQLKGAIFQRTNLSEAVLEGADLSYMDFSYSQLQNSLVSKANLTGARLYNAHLDWADFSGTNLTKADLRGASLFNTNLTYSDMTEATLSRASLIETNLEQSTLSNCKIYGISAWNLRGVPKNQSNLVITEPDESEVWVDDIQVAQFIYLLLNNKNVRNVIDTVTSKAVLILGRFTNERKTILDALHNELRLRGYLPILFDFTKPQSRDLTETVSTLAHMAKFIIADITDAKSIPQELQVIVPNLPSVAVQPILLNSQFEYGMFEHFKRYPWVLPIYTYSNIDDLVRSISDKIINPAELKVKEIVIRK